ncbi:MAG: putative sulfoacetate transporter SauU [Syntrophaceae bacterium PtaU1.Bin231]|nr:MAG: putative sulfoacetate transporter SauU [Syntrophaceae bacterium PtaU1.Bin231]
MPSGYWIDALGEKKVLLWGLGLMAAVGVTIAFIGSVDALLILLFLIGVGYSTTAPGTNKAVMNRIPLSWRATVMGLKQTGVTLGGVLAALAVPVILTWGWRALFVLLGGATLAACLSLALLYAGRQCGSEKSEPSPRRRLPLREVFANRRLLLLAGAGFFLGGCQLSILAYTFLYLKEGLALSVTAAGLGVGWVQFTAAVARLGAGFVSDRLLGQRRRPVMIFFAAAMAVALCCGFLLPRGWPIWVVFAVFGLIGMAGMGFNGIYMTFAMELSALRASGLATSVAVTAVMTGGIVFPPLLGWFVDASGWFAAVWGVMALLPLAAMALILPIQERCGDYRPAGR